MIEAGIRCSRKPEKFWAREAAELLWNKKWTKVLDWKVPFAKWFVGGKLNVSENCLDRHLGTARQNKAALLVRQAVLGAEGSHADRR